MPYVTLVVQGSEDRILPIDATGRRLPDLVKDIRFVEVEGVRRTSAGLTPTRSTAL